jgi:8-amino-7-oxononanoate synthase
MTTKQVKDDISAFIDMRKQTGTLRVLEPLQRLAGGHVMPAENTASEPCLDFSSNDYLALSQHPAMVDHSRQALEKTGTGSGAARLMSGSLVGHHLLEEEIARFKGTEAALVIGSGYLANTGVIPALAGRGDVVFCDRLNHASIYDGCRLSGARIHRFRHNDSNHLESLLKQHRKAYRQALIVVESLYSMDGDRCPLAEIVALKNRFHCLLMVDEAHATGIFGPTGAGIIEEDGVVDQVDIALGTFGKALGSYGAYVAASGKMVQYLINRARTFIYSTSLPPAVIGASLAALRIVQTEPDLRRQLQAKVALFKEYLTQGGVSQPLGPSQIIPLVVGDSARAVAIARRLKEHRIYATAVRPPTVPEGSARIRFSITRHHQPADLRRTAESILSVINR